MRGLILLMAAALICTPARAQTAAERTPLTSVGAVTDLDAPADPDDPGVGGGFDQASYFRNRFIPFLRDCPARIQAVFRGWSTEQGLSLPLNEADGRNITMHATKPSLGGFFELTYRMSPQRDRARVSVYFVTLTGQRLSPLQIQALLDRWGIATLQDKLDTALACDADR